MACLMACLMVLELRVDKLFATVLSPRGSRVADNFLRTARLCLTGETTELLGTFPPMHRMRNLSFPNASRYGTGLPCLCVRRPPEFWWSHHRKPAKGGSSHVVVIDEAPAFATMRGAKGPAELCRCSTCRFYCDYDPWESGKYAPRRPLQHQHRNSQQVVGPVSGGPQS